MSFIKRLNLKVRLVLFIIALTCITIAIISMVSIKISKGALEAQTIEQLSSQGYLSLKRVNSYLARTVKSTSTIASNRLTEGLFIAYESTFYGSSFEVGEDLDIDNDYYKSLDSRYLTRKEKTLKDLDIEDYLLANTGGQVVFSANNSTNKDYLGKNLINGVYKKSPIKTCFEKAFADEKSSVHFTDFFLNKLTNKVEAFFCKSKVAEFDNMDEGISKGDSIGVVLVKLSSNHLDSLLNISVGSGETGQSYIIGSDFLIRSNSFVNNKEYNPIKSFSKNIKIDNTAVVEGLNGKSGHIIAENIENKEMISSYRPFTLLGSKYVLITEKETSEVMSSITSLISYILFISAGVFLLVALLCMLVLNKIINPILEANNSLFSISRNLLTGASDLEKTSEELGRGSASLTSSIQQTVASMDEITGMVNSTIQNVSASKKSSVEMTENAGQGKKAVGQMQVSVNEISNNNDDVVHKMGEVVKHIEDFKSVVSEIGEKTKVINDIVFQTKLLSFNASVEAARAGEHGKGFSVVAEEVGLLAKASGEAADEIGVLIEHNLKKVSDIVDETTSKVDDIKQNGSIRISEGHKKSKECGQVLESIIKSVTDVSAKIESIEKASTEQADGITEINKAIHLIDNITQETSVIASKNKDSAESLSKEAEKLESIYKMLNLLVTGK